MFLHSLIYDFHVSFYHHQAFDSNEDEKIYSLEYKETEMLHNKEQNFTSGQMLYCCIVFCSKLISTNPAYFSLGLILNFSFKTTYMKKKVDLFINITRKNMFRQNLHVSIKSI